MAPFLFIIVANGLAELMREAKKKGVYAGFLVGKDKVEVDLLHYADDTMFFGDATVSNVLTIKAILRGFELFSGLKINFDKSMFGAFRVSELWVQNSATIINSRLLVFPFVYLGLLIGANLRRAETWEPIVAKFQRKLSKWRQRHLSFGGRVCLIKSVLNSVPIFYIFLL